MIIKSANRTIVQAQRLKSDRFLLSAVQRLVVFAVLHRNQPIPLTFKCAEHVGE